MYFFILHNTGNSFFAKILFILLLVLFKEVQPRAYGYPDYEIPYNGKGRAFEDEDALLVEEAPRIGGINNYQVIFHDPHPLTSPRPPPPYQFTPNPETNAKPITVTKISGVIKIATQKNKDPKQRGVKQVSGQIKISQLHPDQAKIEVERNNGLVTHYGGGPGRGPNVTSSDPAEIFNQLLPTILASIDRQSNGTPPNPVKQAKSPPNLSSPNGRSFSSKDAVVKSQAQFSRTFLMPQGIREVHMNNGKRKRGIRSAPEAPKKPLVKLAQLKNTTLITTIVIPLSSTNPPINLTPDIVVPTPSPPVNDSQFVTLPPGAEKKELDPNSLPNRHPLPDGNGMEGRGMNHGIGLGVNLGLSIIDKTKMLSRYLPIPNSKEDTSDTGSTTPCPPPDPLTGEREEIIYEKEIPASQPEIPLLKNISQPEIPIEEKELPKDEGETSIEEDDTDMENEPTGKTESEEFPDDTGDGDTLFRDLTMSEEEKGKNQTESTDTSTMSTGKYIHDPTGDDDKDVFGEFGEGERGPSGDEENATTLSTGKYIHDPTGDDDKDVFGEFGEGERGPSGDVEDVTTEGHITSGETTETSLDETSSQPGISSEAPQTPTERKGEAQGGSEIPIEFQTEIPIESQNETLGVSSTEPGELLGTTLGEYTFPPGAYFPPYKGIPEGAFGENQAPFGNQTPIEPGGAIRGDNQMPYEGQTQMPEGGNTIPGDQIAIEIPEIDQATIPGETQTPSETGAEKMPEEGQVPKLGEGQSTIPGETSTISPDAGNGESTLMPEEGKISSTPGEEGSTPVAGEGETTLSPTEVGQPEGGSTSEPGESTVAQSGEEVPITPTGEGEITTSPSETGQLETSTTLNEIEMGQTIVFLPPPVQRFTTISPNETGQLESSTLKSGESEGETTISLDGKPEEVSTLAAGSNETSLSPEGSISIPSEEGTTISPIGEESSTSELGQIEGESTISPEEIPGQSTISSEGGSTIEGSTSSIPGEITIYPGSENVTSSTLGPGEGESTESGQIEGNSTQPVEGETSSSSQYEEISTISEGGGTISSEGSTLIPMVPTEGGNIPQTGEEGVSMSTGGELITLFPTEAGQQEEITTLMEIGKSEESSTLQLEEGETSPVSETGKSEESSTIVPGEGESSIPIQPGEEASISPPPGEGEITTSPGETGQSEISATQKSEEGEGESTIIPPEAGKTDFEGLPIPGESTISPESEGSTLIPGESTISPESEGSTLIPGESTISPESEGSTLIPGESTISPESEGSTLIPGESTISPESEGSTLNPGESTISPESEGSTLIPGESEGNLTTLPSEAEQLEGGSTLKGEGEGDTTISSDAQESSTFAAESGVETISSDLIPPEGSTPMPGEGITISPTETEQPEMSSTIPPDAEKVGEESTISGEIGETTILPEIGKEDSTTLQGEEVPKLPEAGEGSTTYPSEEISPQPGEGIPIPSEVNTLSPNETGQSESSTLSSEEGGAETTLSPDTGISTPEVIEGGTTILLEGSTSMTGEEGTTISSESGQGEMGSTSKPGDIEGETTISPGGKPEDVSALVTGEETTISPEGATLIPGEEGTTISPIGTGEESSTVAGEESSTMAGEESSTVAGESGGETIISPEAETVEGGSTKPGESESTTEAGVSTPIGETTISPEGEKADEITTLKQEIPGEIPISPGNLGESTPIPGESLNITESGTFPEVSTQTPSENETATPQSTDITIPGLETTTSNMLAPEQIPTFPPQIPPLSPIIVETTTSKAQKDAEIQDEKAKLELAEKELENGGFPFKNDTGDILKENIHKLFMNDGRLQLLMWAEKKSGYLAKAVYF